MGNVSEILVGVDYVVIVNYEIDFNSWKYALVLDLMMNGAITIEIKCEIWMSCMGCIITRMCFVVLAT